MNIQFLRSFETVARLGSLSAAAQAMGLSQPAVTQHIKALEQQSGRALLTRGAAGAELTPEGEALLPGVRQALLAVDAVRAQIRDRISPQSGYLTVGQCAPHVVMPLLRRFTETCPEVQLDVLFDNSARLLDMVERSRLDVAMLTLSAPLAHLTCEPLVRQRLLALLPARHPLAGQDEIDMADLSGQRILMREIGSTTRKLFEDTARHQGIVFRDQLVLGSREAVKEGVAAGLGAGMVLSTELGADARLTARPIRGGAEAWEYLVCRPELRHLGVVARFFDIAAALHAPA